MNSILAFVIFGVAVALAMLTDDPAEDVHIYVSACALLLAVIVRVLDDIRAQLGRH